MNAGTPLVRIIADDRENAGGVIAELRRIEGVEVEVRRLRTGDFVVAGRFVVERKTLRDLAASVIDRRLFKQAARLAVAAERGVIILEGGGRELAESGMSRESLQGALITVSVFYGLALLRARDATETARLLTYLAGQAAKCATGAWTRAGYRPKGKRARQLFILQGLPGVGPGRAARLLERFGTVKGVAVASAEEWGEIEGIGEATAEKIRWALEESPAAGKDMP
jgi:ERCC4-type nuclease